jgi:Xaa-Pro dipeptidase
MDTACAKFTVYMPNDNVIGYPESYVGRHDRTGMQFIAEEIVRRGWGARSIGVEMSAHFFSACLHAELRHHLPNAKWVDASLLVDWVRTYKSDAEIAVMRSAGRIADRGMQIAAEIIAPGVRECDAAAEIFRTLIRGTPDEGGGTPASISMPSGAKTAAPHLRWDDAAYTDGTSVNIELGGNRHNYHAGLSRTIQLGKAPVSLSDLASATIEGFLAALGAARPGAACEDVELAWRKVIERHGRTKPSRIGYAIGLCFQPTWIELTASLQEGDRTILEPNMTFHIICGMWKEECNFVISETVRISDDDAESLAETPRELLVRT